VGGRGGEGGGTLSMEKKKLYKKIMLDLQWGSKSSKVSLLVVVRSKLMAILEVVVPFQSNGCQDFLITTKVVRPWGYTEAMIIIRAMIGVGTSPGWTQWGCSTHPHSNWLYSCHKGSETLAPPPKKRTTSVEMFKKILGVSDWLSFICYAGNDINQHRNPNPKAENLT